MKKFFGFLLLALVFLSIGAITINYIPGANSWVQGWLPGAPDGSSEELPEETPVYNIGDHDRHIFEAINDEIILTVTLVPSDAYDQTLVWTSSAPTSVSVTAATALTAKIKCLADFDGNVTITVTATNGTTDTSDDVSATCVCTFYHAITSFQLGFDIDDNINDTLSINAGGFKADSSIYSSLFVLDTTDENAGYRFSVSIYPENATYQDFKIITVDGKNPSGQLFGSWGEAAFDGPNATYEGETYPSFNSSNNTEHTYFNGYSYNQKCLNSFNVYQNQIGQPYVFVAISDDGIHSDVFTLQVGEELASGDLAATTVSFSPNNTVYTGDTAGAYSVDAWLTLVNDYPEEGGYKNVGSYVKIDLPNLNVKLSDYTVTVNSTYFEVVDDGSNVLDSGSFIILKAIAATGATPTGVLINFTNYPSQELHIPFYLASPVTGISLDHTTVTF